MKINTNSIKKLILCLIKLVVGVLLLVNPETFTVAVITGLGILLLVDGGIGLYAWWKHRNDGEKNTFSLVKTVCLLVIGIVLALFAGKFVVLFPMMAAVYGILAVITGLVQLIWTVDLIRMKSAAWPWQAVSAAVSILLGILILVNPFATANALWIFTGVIILISAVPDVLTLLTTRKTNKT